MFIGHFAPAFVAAAISPRSPGLGTLFIGAQLVDWAFFALAIAGIEKMRIDPDATAMVPYDFYHYPITHSLLGTGAWALGFALLILFFQRNLVGALLAGLVVMSHWVLDWLTHAPDLTLAGGEKTYGLGLWDMPFIAIPLEIILTLAAFVFYTRRTRGPIGQPLILIGLMLVLQAVNWLMPHPTELSIALYLQAFIAFGVLTAIAAWVGENRYYRQRGGLAAASL